MAKQVRLTLAKAIAKANLRRAEAGEKPITMNSLAVQAGVAATTITRLARTDDNAASALSLDLAGKIIHQYIVMNSAVIAVMPTKLIHMFETAAIRKP